jgi:hypothetical protein
VLLLSCRCLPEFWYVLVPRVGVMCDGWADEMRLVLYEKSQNRYLSLTGVLSILGLLSLHLSQMKQEMLYRLSFSFCC